jgi:hypothetical protein
MAAVRIASIPWTSIGFSSHSFVSIIPYIFIAQVSQTKTLVLGLSLGPFKLVPWFLSLPVYPQSLAAERITHHCEEKRTLYTWRI